MGRHTDYLSDEITIIKGNDEELILNFIDKYDVPIDLTDDIIYLSVKKFLDDGDEEIIIDISQDIHTSATEGITSITLSSTLLLSIPAGQYVYEITRKTSSEIKRARYGILNILDNIKNIIL